MNMTASPTFEIVRLIDLQPQGGAGYCLVVAPSASAFRNELREEVDLQLSESLRVIDASGLTVASLLDRLRTSRAAVAIVTGFDRWTDDQFIALDVNRSRLETGAFLVFHADLETARRFLAHAPNVRSFLGPNIFAWAPDDSAMNPREVADRLKQLRDHYDLSDAEVLDRAARNDLPPDPEFVEWLVLLGRSELVR